MLYSVLVQTGLSDIASYEGNSKLLFHKTKSNNVSNCQEINLTSIQPGTYSIIPLEFVILLVNTMHHQLYCPTTRKQHTSAVDFAILKLLQLNFKSKIFASLMILIQIKDWFC